MDKRAPLVVGLAVLGAAAAVWLMGPAPGGAVTPEAKQPAAEEALEPEPSQSEADRRRPDRPDRARPNGAPPGGSSSDHRPPEPPAAFDPGDPSQQLPATPEGVEQSLAVHPDAVRHCFSMAPEGDPSRQRVTLSGRIEAPQVPEGQQAPPGMLGQISELKIEPELPIKEDRKRQSCFLAAVNARPYAAPSQAVEFEIELTPPPMPR